MQDSVSRVPYWLYSDLDIYERELERIFYGRHWCYVGLEAELPEPKSFKTSWVGERAVIVTRDRHGEVHVVENHCAHRGVRFCRKKFGQAKTLVCPYHQWSYSLDGRLLGVPFRNGVKGQGGMPEDFALEDHGLTKLKVAVRGGLIFACFDHDVEPLEEYLGPEVLAYYDRTFDGRDLKVLGYSRQRIPGNWKLMMENIKDGYHPGLLHTWFVTFGLWRADQKSCMIMDARKRHACMVSSRNAGGDGEVTKGVSSFRKGLELNDGRLLDVVPEEWWGEPTVVMTTLFPSVILQQQVNSLSTRHIIPRGPDAFDFVWTHFGFAEDSEEMTRRRLRQANLFGPAGFVSADDGEVIEFAQQGMVSDPWSLTVSELDGTGTKNTEHMVTECLIRGMYEYYREVMEL
ncbi:Rieske 2Fe-2S domain-containing protein [Parasphingopyxis algicola]|nr:Rieske 2Fe-2S domain-containing protein [Parasphingopyxis algicola]